jgi:Concanavalin A-like lectin/glucanases superfamily/Chitobiase/beta-hexosaminidase C-terminal domain
VLVWRRNSVLKIPLLFLSAQRPQRRLFRRLRIAKFFLEFWVVLFAHGLTTGYVDAQLQNGLLIYWSFDDGSGAIANDTSGNGRSATLRGPSWVTDGKIAGALSFDGLDDDVVFWSQPQNAISISAWVYARPTPGNLFPTIINMAGYALFLAEPGAPGSAPMSLGFVSRRSAQDGEWDTPANSIAYNSWHHIAVVYDSSSTSNNPDLYINGVKQTISQIASPQGTQTVNGGNGELGIIGKDWDGLIDELRIHDRALTEAEIVSLYDQGNSGPFNFSLANSMSLSAAHGSSATNTITANLLAGSPTPVSFSASTLPSGASASFSQTACSPTCSSLLTVATAAWTQAGTYTVSVTGAGGGVTKTTSFSLTVTSAASTAINSPAQGVTLAPGQTVTATGSGTNLRWDIDLWSEGLPAFKTGTGSSITFTVPADAISAQIIRITLAGNGGLTTRDYNITGSAPPITPTVASPTFSPSGGSFTGSVSVTLQEAISGASIYYSTDGSTPTQSSTLYTGPFTLTSSAIVKAIAFMSGSNPSAQASAHFTVALQPSQLTLVWNDNSDNEDHFAIERKTEPNGTYSQIALIEANSTSYVDTAVTGGVACCYRVLAVNSVAASANSNEACGTAP